MPKHLLSVFVLILLFFVSCASQLKEENDIARAPEKMLQKVEDFSADLSKQPIDKEALQKKKSPKSKKGRAFMEEKQKAVEGFVQQWPFGLNEISTFAVRYGPIEGGRATIEVAPPKKVEGEIALHYITRARSDKLFDLFYRIDDTVESWVRLKDHLPLRHEILQNESGEWGRRIVIFDQIKKRQHFYSSTTRPNRPTKIIDEKHELFNNPQDILGALFFSRFIKDPKKISFPVHDRFKHWNNEYIFEEKEELNTKAGVFKCNRYRLYPRVQGNLEPQGNAFIWISDDPRKILVKFKVKIRIGSITGDLVEYIPGKPWDLPLPRFATPIDLDPAKVVSNQEVK